MQNTSEAKQGFAETGGTRRDEFLAILSHELRSPLMSICNAVRILHQERTPAERHKALEIIERQTGQLRQFVEEIFELSRIVSGHVDLHLTHIDLRNVVDQALETTRPLIERHSHSLTITMPLAPVWIEADAGRLRQVLINLLENAAKYTGEHGELRLSAYQEGEEALVRVRDNGIGIDAQTLPHIFDLFAQANHSPERTEGGLGVGLALVRKLVELHGGTVSCVSAGPGQGSEFIVSLPAASGQPLEAAPLRRETGVQIPS